MNESTKTPMTQSDAARIQAHADRTGTNQGFKAAAQTAAAKNGGAGKAPAAPKGGSGKK